MNIKIKLNFFSHNKLKLQPRARKRLILILTVLFNDIVICSVQCELFCSM